MSRSQAGSARGCRQPGPGQTRYAGVGVDPRNPHRLAEARSLALHQEVARRLVEHPELLDGIRERVRAWLVDGTVARPYAEAWQALLERAPEDVAIAIVDPSERARDMRQCSPFAGLLPSRDRWRILRELSEGVLR